MRRKTNIVILLLLWLVSAALATEIYDVQYTEQAGDGTYPSLYEDQYVNLSGIVTCNNYNDDKFVLSSPSGSAWNGILVYEGADWQLGDFVSLTGAVTEYYGLTELLDVYNMQLLSQGNPLPAPATITTAAIAQEEAYEGVLVTVENVVITSSPDEWDNYYISDGSGDCKVSTYCLALDEYEIYPQAGTRYSSITGIVTYSYGEYYLLPRSLDDMIIDHDGLHFNLPDITVADPIEVALPIELYYTGADTLLNSLQIEILYDNFMVEYIGSNFMETMLTEETTSVTITDNQILISAENLAFTDSGDLIYLIFAPLRAGISPVSFSSLLVNDEIHDSFTNGSITYQPLPSITADEITLVQQPILSVPQIVEDGAQLTVTCVSPAATTGWQGTLQWQDIQLPLTLSSSQFLENNDIWMLIFDVPSPDIYTTYDLVIQAENVIPDTTVNSVCLIPEYKENYSFIHITDTHLPGHTFFGNDPQGTDFSEIDDFRKVIRDINIINPEFVIFTGDVVNEGELQDYNGRYQFSIAKNLLTELNVPVFVTTGNHDVGGWNDTTPPDGSARHNWHRFFGWEYLENPPTGGIYTQNYYFQYDNVLFAGLESYINYDYYLPAIFGDSSFTTAQMGWLQELLNSSSAESKVLFYHYDFDEELDLSALGVDMALWGHIHSNSGSINQQPYNLATAAVCDGNSAFRLINVENNILNPQLTCYSQTGIGVEYSYPNSGIYQENEALVNNPHQLDFSNCLLTFIMPPANSYELENCALAYIKENDDYNQVAVHFLLPANQQISISVCCSNSHNPDSLPSPQFLNAYPNPFNPQITIEFALDSTSYTEINIYNIKGQKTAALANDIYSAGKHQLVWDASSSDLSSGIYLITITSKSFSKSAKIVLLK